MWFQKHAGAFITAQKEENWASFHAEPGTQWTIAGVVTQTSNVTANV